MDRRSLLAIVLSTLVILIFQFFLFPSPKSKAPRTTPAAVSDSSGGTAAPAPADSHAVEAFTGTPTLRQAPGATASTFPVKMDGVEARFSSRGGVIESWRLTRFDGPTGEPVELVRNGGEPQVALQYSRGAGGPNRIDLNDGLYLSDVQETPGGGQVITFQAGEPGQLQVVKRYRIAPESPLVTFEVELSGLPADASETWLEIGWFGGLPQAERIAKSDDPTYGAIWSIGKDIRRLPATGFKKDTEKVEQGAVNWVSSRNKYFMVGLVPAPGTVNTVVARGSAAEHRAGAGLRYALTGTGDVRQSLQLYLGPLDYFTLRKLGYKLENAIDLGWKIIIPFSQVLLWLLGAGYRLIPNYGIVIILLSAFTKLLFYPMTRSSMHSMRAMQEIQPEVQRLQKKYKDDPNRMNQEVFALYRKHKISPLGGCLPLLLQMPVFFALYTVLANSVALRQAPFVGWINDLSSPDVLLRIGGFSLHALPILMSATMFWQQKITPTAPGQAANQALMLYMMPIMMLFFLYGVPSGLALYWTVVNILSVGQQYIFNRERAARAEAA